MAAHKTMAWSSSKVGFRRSSVWLTITGSGVKEKRVLHRRILCRREVDPLQGVQLRHEASSTRGGQRIHSVQQIPLLTNTSAFHTLSCNRQHSSLIPLDQLRQSLTLLCGHTPAVSLEVGNTQSHSSWRQTAVEPMPVWFPKVFVITPNTSSWVDHSGETIKFETY